ncbi:hypothetical protein B0O99DRAFT_684753 [Bisporella sp. PMI_857]|nr:hypothetical protein B0O99DRAFT_684753 [Bisporella sp. PMI_857]
MSRLPITVENRLRQGLVKPENVYKVQFSRSPWRLRLRTAFIGATVIYLGFSVWGRLVDNQLDRAASILDEEETPEEEELEETAIFFPFPGTTRTIPPRPYRATDPEWQEFIQISKNQALLESLRGQLAEQVREDASKQLPLVVWAGKDFKLRRFWLDVDFPLVPSPEFERSGLQIDDEGEISWVTVPVDSDTVFKLQRILWPAHLFQSVFTTYKAILLDDSKRLGRYLGIYSGPPPPTPEQIAEDAQRRLTRLTGRPIKVVTKASEPTQSVNTEKAISQTPPLDKEPEKDKSLLDSEETKAAASRIISSLHSHFYRPLLEGRKALRRKFQPLKPLPPRGCIMLSGLVEVDATSAWLVFDVKAFWNPKTKAWEHRSTDCKLRRFQNKRQGPPGGR